MMRIGWLAMALALTAMATADARPHTRAPAAPAWTVTAEDRVADLDWLVDQLKAKYAYRDTRRIDLDQIKKLYRDAAVKAATPAAWLGVIERVMAELYDHHATVGRSGPGSPRLVPSNADVWAELIDGEPIVTQVRAGSVAWRAGLRPGATIRSVGGRPVDRIIDDGVPQSMVMPDGEAGSYALRQVLAGFGASRRSVNACARRACRTYSFGPARPERSGALVTVRELGRGIGYIRLENSLGDRATVAQFDKALLALRDANGLILDLRNTPSGGDTDVAEPILARFITQSAGYQRVFEPGPDRRFPADSWVKDIDPRGPFAVTQPLVVLVDHWTGSMGEGLAIGFDALRRATIVGTRMAGLLGGTASFELPKTGVPVRFPIERLYHVNGTPREKFVPPVLVDLTDPAGVDPILAAGIDVLVEKLADP